MRAAERIRYLILAAQREGNRMLAAQLRPLGLTPSQAEVIRVLADRGELTVGELGELLVCESGTNPSRLVERLVDTGMLARRPGEADKRRVILTLTDRGRSADRAVRRIEDALYSAIDAAADGIDVEAVAAYLARLSAGSPSGLAVARR
jgi:DNA-binding MarR family transcriptional regulator